MTDDPDEKILLLRRLVAAPGFRDDVGLIRALVRCLDASQAVSLLFAEAHLSTPLRDAALRKVCTDAQEHCLAIHDELAVRLNQSLQVASAVERQRIGYCLSSFLPSLGAEARLSVLTTLATSRYVSLRRRAYKVLAHESNLPEALVLEAWREHRDPESVWLIAKVFPPQFLVQHRVLLEADCSQGWQLSRLYLRMAEVDENVTRHLLSRDPISYCYVLAKLGKQVSERRARAIVKECKGDERFGLLVWSFGVMRLWNVLSWIGTQLEDIQQERHSAILAMHGMENYDQASSLQYVEISM